MKCSGDERLFPLKPFALCPEATGFDGGGVRSSVGQSEAGALGTGQLLQKGRASEPSPYSRREIKEKMFGMFLSLHTDPVGVLCWYKHCVFHLYLCLCTVFGCGLGALCYCMPQEAYRSAPW